MDDNLRERQEMYKQLKKLLAHGVNLNVLKEVIEQNNITPKDFNDFSELLGIALKHRASVDIIEYFINHRKGKSLNYNLNIGRHGNRYTMTPLMVAIANNEFKTADLLINNNASVNYGIIKNLEYCSIIDILLESRDLNKKNLKYILRKGFSIKRINKDLIFKLINFENHSFLKIILEYWKFDNFFILNLLNLYKNGEKVSNTQFQNLIAKEDNKIQISEVMYQEAVNKRNIDVLKILFVNDCCNRDRIIKRINKYDLLEIFVENNCYPFIKYTLQFKPLSYRCLNYVKILCKLIIITYDKWEKGKQDFIKYIIKSFIYHSSFYNKNEGQISIIGKSQNQIQCHYQNLTINQDKYQNNYANDNNFNLKSNANNNIINTYDNNNNNNNINNNNNNGNNNNNCSGNMYRDKWLRMSLNGNSYDIRYLNLMVNIAIKVGCLPMIEYLIDSNDFKSTVEDINTRDINGELLILSAFYYEKLEIFNYLLDHGADPNTTNKSGVPLLSLAIHKDNVGIIKSLLNCHVNIYSTDTNGVSPFMKAINKNCSEIVELFTSYGNENHINILLYDTNTNYIPNLQEDVKMNDAENNDDKMNNDTIINEDSYGNSNSNHDQSNTNEDSNHDPSNTHPSFNNENSSNISSNHTLITEQPPRMHCTRFNRNSPLIKAINHNNFEMVYALVKYCKSNNISLNIIDVYGNTPLIISYMKGYIEIFKFLAEHLDINQRDIQGNTILHYVVEKKDLKVVKCLISTGADVNALNKSGITVLDRTISRGDYSILKYLLLNDNINVNQRNKNWEIPLITVINDHHYTQEEKEDIVNKLIEKGTNINLVDKENKSSLLYAIQNNYFGIVKILLENGANLNIKDQTTHNLICNVQNYDIVKILYDYGLEIYNADNINFETLKSLIRLNNTHLFKLILDNNINIDVNMRDKESGTTLLQEALHNERIEISNYLIQRGAETDTIPPNNN